MTYTRVVGEPVSIYRFALGEGKTRTAFYVTDRADSSSLLTPAAGQRAAYGVDLATTTTVDVERAADLIAKESLVRPVLFKIDVQGGELAVLNGALPLFDRLDAIYCELSFVELYQNQPKASNVIAFLSHNGFTLRGVFNISFTKRFGPTQGDFLFARDPLG